MNASGIAEFSIASPNQRSVNPVGGQAYEAALVEGVNRHHDERQVEEAEDHPGAATRSATRTQPASTTAHHDHSDSNAPSRRAMSRYTIMMMIGTSE